MKIEITFKNTWEKGWPQCIHFFDLVWAKKGFGVVLLNFWMGIHLKRS